MAQQLITINSILANPKFEAFVVSSRVMSSLVVPKVSNEPTPMYPPDLDDNESITLCKKNR